MISYNTTNSSPTLELNTRKANSGDLAIANLFKDVISAYQINLIPVIYQTGDGGSDHYSFWGEGYSAILAIEDWSDHTPYYHKTTDRLSSLNMDYFTEFAKASVATFAHMGCLQEGALSGSVRDAVSNNPLPGALVEARLSASKSWTATVQADGSYRLPLLPGNYDVKVTAPAHRDGVAQTLIQNAQTNTLNFLLQPCSAVQAVHFNFSPFLPAAGENITFSATVSGTPPFTYQWDFGDGNSGGGEVVSHAYAGNGVFPVTLTISNACSPATAYQAVAVGLERWYFPLAIVSVH